MRPLTPLKSRTTRPLRRSTSNTLPLLSATAHNVHVGAIETFKACRRLSSKHVLLICKVPRLPWLEVDDAFWNFLGFDGS